MLTAALQVCLAGTLLRAVEADVDGAQPGKWTMDLDAAKKLARERKLPILLDFSGSDWCRWCILMEKSVFELPAWQAYAQSNLVMVLVDFPNRAALVPEKYVQRNKDLKEKYEVQGFPSFFVLDEDGETILGRLEAGQNKTPESFLAEMRPMLRYRAVEVAKYTQDLKPEDKDAYLKIVGKMDDCRKGLKQADEQLAATRKKIVDLQKKQAELSGDAAEFRAARLGAEKLKEYKDLAAKREECMKKLNAWLQSQPAQTRENATKFQTMTAEIQDLTSRLAEY
jgi:protein disulfide-isomerase